MVDMEVLFGSFVKGPAQTDKSKAKDTGLKGDARNADITSMSDVSTLLKELKRAFLSGDYARGEAALDRIKELLETAEETGAAIKPGIDLKDVSDTILKAYTARVSLSDVCGQVEAEKLLPKWDNVRQLLEVSSLLGKQQADEGEEKEAPGKDGVFKRAYCALQRVPSNSSGLYSGSIDYPAQMLILAIAETRQAVSDAYDQMIIAAEELNEQIQEQLKKDKEQRDQELAQLEKKITDNKLDNQTIEAATRQLKETMASLAIKIDQVLGKEPQSLAELLKKGDNFVV